jgi:hypothetical protein
MAMTISAKCRVVLRMGIEPGFPCELQIPGARG